MSTSTSNRPPYFTIGMYIGRGPEASTSSGFLSLPLTLLSVQLLMLQGTARLRTLKPVHGLEMHTGHRSPVNRSRAWGGR